MDYITSLTKNILYNVMWNKLKKINKQELNF